MKALVVGGGSIGKRHMQNLRALGIAQLGLVEPNRVRSEALRVECPGLRWFRDLESSLGFSPDFVVIASPSHLHLEQAIAVASSGCDLFVEKPLTHIAEGLSKICDLILERKLVSLVGCNMRFHPGPRTVKKLLSENRIGRILFARLHAGSFLPSWRPGRDYRDNYAAREKTGGGCILDCIHEIDLCRWYLGPITDLFCLADHLSSLEIETEDTAVLVSRHASSAISEVHLDYVQRTYERGCQIVGESGSIFWDFKSPEVRWFDGVSERWNVLSHSPEWNVNEMYLDELRHFVDCVRNRSKTMFPIPEAAELMQVVFAAKSSARTRTMLPVPSEMTA